jgi:hypothetical protein
MSDDGATMEINEVLHQGEAEPQPGMDTGRGTVALTKSLEDVGQDVRCDPLARVSHDDTSVRIDALEKD